MLGVRNMITAGSRFASAVVKKGLQAWYKADRTQAPLGEEKVEDGGFNRSSVKVYNTGKALSFDGSDDYVDFGTDVNSNGTVWTTAIWIGDYTRGNYDWLCGGETKRNIGLNKGSSLTGNVFYRSSDGTYNEFSCEVFKSDFTNAKRLVFTSDGTDISLYIDGEFIDSVTPTTTYLKLSRLMAGYSDATQYLVAATVSDFQLYDVAWTQDDVTFDYNNPQKLVTEAPLREEILGEEEVENGNFETGEVGSTNLITYSEDFSDSSWVEAHYGNATAPVLTLNSSESPDGTQNASRLQIDCGGNSSSDYSYFSQVATLDGSSEYTISFYVKSNTSSDQDFLFFNNNSFGASITATAEWQRVESTFTSNSTNPRKFGLVTKGNVQEEVDILIWGAQLEELPYATSYIKTEGSTQSRANTTEWSDYNSANINATIPKALYLPNGGSYVTQAVTEPGKSYRYVIVARSETSTLSDINLQTGSTIQKVIEDVPTSYTTYIGVIGSDSSSFLLGEGGPGSVIIDSISLKEVTQSSSLSEELLPSISDFTIDVNDTDEVSIVDGSAVFNSSSVGGEYLYKGSVPNINTSGVLELSMTVEDHVSGNVRVYFGNPSAVGNDDLIASGDGTFKINITPDSNTFYIQATGGGFEGTVTAVSAREIVSPTLNNLKGYWHLSEGDGSIVYDSSGEGNDGTIYSGSTIGATWEDQQATIPQLGLMDWSKGSNLLHYSEDFSKWWTPNGTILTEYTTDTPPNIERAWKVEQGSGNKHIAKANISASGKSKGIWAKTVSGTGTVALNLYHGYADSLKTITNEWQFFENTSTNPSNEHFYAVDFRHPSGTLTEVIIAGAHMDTSTNVGTYRRTNGTAVTDATLIADPNNTSEDILGNSLTLIGDKSFNIPDGSITLDSDWVFLSGSIGDKFATVQALGGIGNLASNWSMSHPNVFTMDDSYEVSFTARQTVGSGNFQVGQSYSNSTSSPRFSQVITSEFERYSFDLVAYAAGNSNNHNLSIGGSTVGDEFEIKDITVRKKVNSVRDCSRNSNDATLYSGKALEFDGNGDYVSLEPGDELINSTSYTYAVWFKAQAQAGGDRRIFTTSYTASSTHFAAFFNEDDYLQFYIRNSVGSLEYERFSTLTFADDKWRRLVCVIESDMQCFYLDNTLIGTTYHDMSTTIHSNPIRLACGPSAGDVALKCTLSDFQIYDKAWTPSDVKYDWENPDKDVFDDEGRVEILGEEFVTNGDFSEIGEELIDNGDFELGDNGDWTEYNINTTFNPLLFTNSANNGKIYQTFTTTIGATYKVSISKLSGNWTVYASTTNSTGGSIGLLYLAGTESGSFIFTATTTTTYILNYLIGGAGTEGSITNISVKEVLQGWTMASGCADSATQELTSEGGLKMYSGTVEDARNRMSQTPTLKGYEGRTYKLNITSSDYENTSAGYIRLDSVYSADSIIRFTQSETEVTFTAYRDFDYIVFYAGGADKSYTVNNVSLHEITQNKAEISPTDCKALYRLNEGAGDRVYNAAPVLGVEMWDGANGDITNWQSFGSNTIAEEAGAVKITYVDHTSGGYIMLREAKDLKANLVVGKTYEISFSTKVNQGSITWRCLTSGAGINAVTAAINSTSFETRTMIVVADHETDLYIHPYGITTGDIVWIKDVSVKEISLSNSYAYAGNPEWATAQPYIPQYAMSSYSKKMFFDGSDDLVDCGSDSSIDNIFDGGGSWSAWFSAETDGESSFGNMLSKGNSKRTLRTTSDGGGDITMQFLCSFGGNDGKWSAPTDAVLLNKINHIVVAYNSSSVSNNPKIYINGVSLTVTTETTPTGSVDTDMGNFIIGAQTNAGGYAYDGFIDEVSVFDKELSATEVQELFNSGMALDARDHSASPQAEWLNLTGQEGGLSPAVSIVDPVAIVSSNSLSFDDTTWEDMGDWEVNNGTNNIWKSSTVDPSYSYEQPFPIKSGDVITVTGRITKNDGTYDLYSDVDSDGTIEFRINSTSVNVGISTSSTESVKVGGDGRFTFEHVMTGDLSVFIINADDIKSDPYIEDPGVLLSELSVMNKDYLKGYWRNNGTDTWTDLSDNSNDGTVNGSPTTIQLQEVPYFKKDTFGLPMNKVRQKGLNLDGDSYLKVDDYNDLNMSSGFSTSFWVQVNNIDERQWFLTKGTAINSHAINLGYGTTLHTGGNPSKPRIYTTVNTNVNKYQINTTADLVEGDWVYVTTTYEPNITDGLKLYIDEVLVGSYTPSGTVDETHDIYIGENFQLNTGYRSSSIVDEVKWYNRALSDKEIKRNYKATKSKHKNNTVSNWSDDFTNDFI